MTLLERKGPASLSSLNLIAKKKQKVDQRLENKHLVRKLLNVESNYYLGNKEMNDHRRFHLNPTKNLPSFNTMDPLMRHIANKDRYGKKLLKRMSRQTSRSRVLANLIIKNSLDKDMSFTSKPESNMDTYQHFKPLVNDKSI